MKKYDRILGGACLPLNFAAREGGERGLGGGGAVAPFPNTGPADIEICSMSRKFSIPFPSRASVCAKPNIGPRFWRKTNCLHDIHSMTHVESTPMSMIFPFTAVRPVPTSGVFKSWTFPSVGGMKSTFSIFPRPHGRPHPFPMTKHKISRSLPASISQTISIRSISTRTAM
jgi:hypothetical protein